MERGPKILIFFLLIVLIGVIFLAGVVNRIADGHTSVSLNRTEIEQALRGDIVTADGYHLTKSYKTYSVAIDPDAIDPTKKALFVTLFSIYSGMDAAAVRQLITSDHRVTLLRHIDAKTAKNIKELSTALVKEKVFASVTVAHRTLRKGLEVTEEEFLRIYPYGDTFEPITGYVKKEHPEGVVGLEKSYDAAMHPIADAVLRGERDVGSNIVLNNRSSLQERQDGATVRLCATLALQKAAEKALDDAKTELGAAEIIAAVMEPRTGNILALATSNRYNPSAITIADVPSIKLNAIQYIFEPGSIIKPIIMSILLEKRKVNPYEILPGYMGHYTLGTKTITDEHKMGQMSAEEAIIYSSNIGMAQLGQRLDGTDFYDGLRRFGFTKKSGIDLPYEYGGDTPSIRELNTPIYKATASYGYGMRANFIQILKAYNTITNDGVMTIPRLAGSTLTPDGRTVPLPISAPVSVISPTTAIKIQQILVKVVQEGTGTAAKMEGLVIGGKTGTAHIAAGGRYENSYNSSFFGFVADSKRRYTIGVLVHEPSNGHFAAQTAVPVFSRIVRAMVEQKFLHAPKTWENNQTLP